MFFASPSVVIFFLVLCGLAGVGIGVLTGWLVALATRCATQYGVLKNGLLGSLGSLAGFIGCIVMPWPRNTVVESLEGGGWVATTTSKYQHPEHVAVALAILLPLFHELYRWAEEQTRAIDIKRASAGPYFRLRGQ
jgi:hypothetical protein